MPPIPLPSIDEVRLDAAGISVWRYLLDAEKDALKSSKVAKYQDTLIGVRVLGFFLKDVYEHSEQLPFLYTAYNRLLTEISSCLVIDDVEIGSLEEAQAQYAKMFKLGLHYRNHLMRVFRSDGGPLPTPSKHASRPSFDKVKEDIIQSIAKANPSKTDIKKLALLRDGHRCMITKYYDMNTVTQYQELEAQVIANEYDFTKTECAHLFSESAQDKKPPDYAATAFGILKMFGLDYLVQQLLGGGINSLTNVLTMSKILHEMFDRFEFWLEEVPGQPNCYDLCFQKEYYSRIPDLRNIPKRVTFQVDEDVVARCKAKNIEPPPLPDNRLIAIRAACARVANMAGAAEQADRILDDREDTKVLADDGSSAQLLTSLLLQSPAYVDAIA